ncbi:MAG: efflux RND transporter periplasmic adaptor subunit [Desulfobacterales bacterium]
MDRFILQLRSIIRSRKFKPAAAAFTIVLAIVLWWGIKGEEHSAHDVAFGPPPAAGTIPDAELSVDAAIEANQYVCPMMCVPPMDAPGHCPVCGMELVAVGHGHSETEAHPRGLTLTPGETALAGIEVAPVERRHVTAEVRLFGQIDYDPAHSTVITSFMPGVIDRLYIKRAGQFVRWGDPLFDLYSSDLLETQKQLVEALKYVPSFYAFQRGTPHVAQDMPIQPRETGKGDISARDREEALETVDAVRHKLSILGLPKRDIDEFMKVGEATGVATVYAPMYGQVTVQSGYEGTYVNRGTPVLTIADPEYVWLRMDAYEMDYAWIRKGQAVTFTTEAYPGETFQGKVVYIDPVFDAQSRTFRIGAISTEDQGGRLKAGMLARAVIHSRLDAEGRVLTETADPQTAPLVIPDTAALMTGKRAVVYVADPEKPGFYEGREVVLGPRAKDAYVVKAGLAEGELVVVYGNFKIDSALQIQARPSFMSPEGGAMTDADHGHQGISGGMGSMTGPDGPEPDVRPVAGDHSGLGDEVENTARNGVPATEHQLPGESILMHETYMEERRSSRTADSATDDRIGNDGDPGGGDEAVDSRSIRRRRPGMYGDPTRPRITRPRS